MCGRYTLKTPPMDWGQLLLPLIDSQTISASWQPRYNIAPTQNVLAVFQADASAAIGSFRWGLLPGWAKDASVGSRMINARSETLHEKRSFSGPLKNKRCMIIADGYYEWQKLANGKKQACWIAPEQGGVMLLAGLWESNRRIAEQPILSCTIITTAANDNLSSIHDRMPVVLDEDAAERWLKPKLEPDDARTMLRAAEDDFFNVRQVSSYVNNARHEGEECIVAVGESS